MGLLKYFPTPAQLLRWRNETTILIASLMGGVVALHEFIGPLANLDPRFKGVAVVLGGIVARWNSYGKETIEQDRPMMADDLVDTTHGDVGGAGTWIDHEMPSGKPRIIDRVRDMRRTPEFGDI